VTGVVADASPVITLQRIDQLGLLKTHPEISTAKGCAGAMLEGLLRQERR